MIEDDLRTFILADSAIAALVGARLYPEALPQAPVLPAMSYSLIDADHIESHQGSSGLAASRFQISSWAVNYQGAAALARLLRLRLQGHQGTIGVDTDLQAARLIGERVDHETETGYYRRDLDFELWHAEEIPA